MYIELLFSQQFLFGPYAFGIYAFAVFLPPLFPSCHCFCGWHFKDKLFRCPPEKEGAAFEGAREMVFFKWSQTCCTFQPSNIILQHSTMLALPLSVFLGFGIWLAHRQLEGTLIQPWSWYKAANCKYCTWYKVGLVVWRRSNICVQIILNTFNYLHHFHFITFDTTWHQISCAWNPRICFNPLPKRI